MSINLLQQTGFEAGFVALDIVGQGDFVLMCAASLSKSKKGPFGGVYFAGGAC